MKEKKIKKHSKRIIFMIGIIATIFAIIITSTGLFNTLESRSIDWRFNLRGEVKPSAPVVIVGIDDSSFANMPERWMWPRTFYAKVVDNLKKWGAKAIVFDMVFSEPTAKDPNEDKIFARSIKKAGNVILGLAILQENTGKGTATRILYPIKELKDAAFDMGLIHHKFSETDSYIRETYLFLESGEEIFYSMALKSIGLYYGLKADDLKIGNDRLTWGKMNIPLYKGNLCIINFSGPAGTFNVVPFYKVYYGNDIDTNVFKNKIVLIGSTAELLHDVFLTSFSMDEIELPDGGTAKTTVLMPGVEIHANVINTIFSGQYLKRMEPGIGLLLVLTIGILTSFLIFNIKAWHGLIVVVFEIFIYFFVATYLFNSHNYIIDFVNPVFSMVLCCLAISTYKVGVEEREKRKIKNIFSKYLSSNVVEELIKSEDIKLGGERKEITVLFSDIRNFTSMSEKLTPEEVVAMLNEYLSEMTDAIFSNGGTLDKFIGDAVMAIFGTPGFQKDHALRAVKTGFLMLKKLEQLNAGWKKEGKHEFKIGIGINTGIAVAGNMGSLKRMEYTVIGDTVNLASRLESLNKELDTQFLISETTYEQVKDFVKVRKYENILIKGKQEKIDVYEVLDLIR
ncbi:MAG TPA: adenylate/guanylate cyclase domain-containing protein [Candidatus Goldiibacteriota bacterium]|nr:adenylate/guanylate cyclase domain-containing protein [Candidatus Goldiibacteriota bacterium]